MQNTDQDAGASRRKRRRFALPLSPAQSTFEWLAMALLLVASVGGMWFFGGAKIWSFSPLLLVLAVGLTLFFLRPLVFGGVDRLSPPPGGLLALLSLAWVSAWLPFAPVPFDAVVTLLKLASAVMAYWAWADLSRHHRRWRVLLAVLIFGVTLMGWYALIQNGHDSNLVLNRVRPAQYAMRASGAYICPNHFAHLVAMALTVSLALLLCREAGGALRLLAGYAWLVLAPALYLTQSRSGFLGLAAGVLVVLGVTGWRAGPRRFLLRVLAGSLALALAAWMLWLFSPAVQVRVAQALQGDVRLDLWRDTWAMIAARPWQGFGPGSFRWVFPHFQQHFRAHADPEYAHNEFLHAVAEYGFPGAALIVLSVLIAAGLMLFRLRRSQNDRDVFLVAGALGAWAASAVHGLFDYNLQIFANLHVLMLVSGVAAAGLSNSGPKAPPAASRVGVRVAAVAGLVATLSLAFFTARSWAAWRFSERGAALRVALAPDAARVAFERSRAWAPWYHRPLIGLGDLARSRAFWLRKPEEKQKAADEALACYAQAERLNPWDMDAGFGRSRVLRHLGQSDQALAALGDIVKRVPYQAYYLAQWGAALSDAGRYAEALEAFQRSQAGQPSSMASNYIAWLQQKLPPPTAKPAAPPAH